MIRVSSEHVVFSMSSENSPVVAARSGDTVVFETLDCFGCQLQKDGQKLETLNWDNINPATGPLYVEGACPGDVLKVEILQIELDDHGVMVNMPGEGVFGERLKQDTTRLYPLEGDKVRFRDDILLDLSPMVGVIGTAPAADSVSTGTPGRHGGNMDCKRISEQSTLYLPVEVDGALLAMGDLHSVMGDGEVGVCGVETAGAVTVRVTVLKDCRLPVPFVETPEIAAAIYSAESLDDAAAGAAFRMQDFLKDVIGMDIYESASLLSAAGNLCICQVVDPLKTCRMELPVKILEKLGYRA